MSRSVTSRVLWADAPIAGVCCMVVLLRVVRGPGARGCVHLLLGEPRRNRECLPISRFPRAPIAVVVMPEASRQLLPRAFPRTPGLMRAGKVCGAPRAHEH